MLSGKDGSCQGGGAPPSQTGDAFAGRQRGYHRSPADLLYGRYRPQVINDTNAASCVCTHTNTHVQLLHLPRRLCCAEALHHPHFPPREELAQLQAPSSPRGKHTSQCHHGLCPRPRASRRSVNNTSSTPPCVCVSMSSSILGEQSLLASKGRNNVRWRCCSASWMA